MMASVERPQKMDVDVIRPGDLADDERTETERSPLVEKLCIPVAAREDMQPTEVAGIDRNMANDAELADDDASRRGVNNNKKHRRGKNKGGKRHWKPYNKLSWEERKALDERESRRAQRKRQQRFANGQPMAPYNTTQFLMEQHQVDDDIEDNLRQRNEAAGDNVGLGNGSGSVDSSEEYIDSPEDDDLFMAKDFSETYDNVHAERLQNMTKEELVIELLELESRVERLEKKDDGASRTSERPSDGGNNPADNVTVTDVTCVKDNVTDSVTDAVNRKSDVKSTDSSAKASFEAEITRLKQENEKLRQENAKLRSATEGGRSPSA